MLSMIVNSLARALLKIKIKNKARTVYVIVFVFCCTCLIWFWTVCYLWTRRTSATEVLHTCIHLCHELLPHRLVFSGDVQTLTLSGRGIISRLGLVREQGHRVGPVFLQTQGLWNDLAAPFNYHPNYNCITLHACGRSQRMVNKYSHIISTSEWKQRMNRATGDMDVPLIGPNLVWTQPNLMWVNNEKGNFFVFPRLVSKLCQCSLEHFGID